MTRPSLPTEPTRRACGCPSSTVAARDRWRHGSDQVRLFVEERVLRVTEEPITSGASLYAAYKQWAATNGHRNALANNRLGERLEALELGIRRYRRAEGNFWNMEVSR